MSSSSSSFTRPFLKWPGGKFRLLTTLHPLLPKGTHLVEPFMGAGAVSLNAFDFNTIILNDLNGDLICLYHQLLKHPKKFITRAKSFFNARENTAARYYEHRTEFNSTNDLIQKACLFLYLNRHGYNGLCRYNQKGAYNVPFGAYTTPYFPEKELEFFAERTKQFKFFSEDYQILLKRYLKRRSLKGWVFYCDPPYAPLKTTTFTHYAGTSFKETDQINLAALARDLSKKGAHVLISNHSTPFTINLYKGAKIHHCQVSRSINCKGSGRERVSELIAHFLPET